MDISNVLDSIANQHLPPFESPLDSSIRETFQNLKNSFEWQPSKLFKALDFPKF